MSMQHKVYLAVFSSAFIFYQIFKRGKQVPDSENAITINKELFHTSATFNVLAIGITGILAALYIIFW